MDAPVADTFSPHTPAVAGPPPESADSSLAGEANTTRAVDRALSVLCAFSRETPTLGVTELSERLDLTKSTVHRLLQVLLARGMVMQEADRKRYSLGYRVLALAQAIPLQANLRHMCRPHMEKLRHTTQETVALYVIAGDVRMCLEEIESPQVLRMVAGEGRCFPLGRGAASKALLLDTSPQDTLWRRATALLAPAECAQFAQDLDAARQRGYANSSGETVSGAASLAAPIRDRHAQIIAALSVAGPASRFDEATVAHYATELLEATHAISRDLAAAGTSFSR